jgi:hypothetical protein
LITLSSESRENSGDYTAEMLMIQGEKIERGIEVGVAVWPITAFFNRLLTAHGNFNLGGLGLPFLSFPLDALTSPTPQYLCSLALFLNRHGVSR